MFGIVFGTDNSPAKERIRNSVAERGEARAAVDQGRGEINHEIAKRVEIATAKELYALATLKSANTADENAISAYAGGDARADADVSLRERRDRRTNSTPMGRALRRLDKYR